MIKDFVIVDILDERVLFWEQGGRGIIGTGGTFWQVSITHKLPFKSLARRSMYLLIDWANKQRMGFCQIKRKGFGPVPALRKGTGGSTMERDALFVVLFYSKICQVEYE